MTYRPEAEIFKAIEGEADKCSGCRRCMEGCPMLKAYCSSPKSLLKDFVETNEVAEIIPYSCSLCGYCTEVCPEAVDLKQLFYDMRKDIYSINKGYPEGIRHRPVELHQKASFSRLLSTPVEGLNKEATVKRVFFPGCSLTAARPDLVIKAYGYLREKLPGTGVIMNCCGKPTESMGAMDSFQTYYSNIQHSFDSEGVEEVIVACLNCFKTIGKNSPHQRVVTLWQLMADIGIPEDKISSYQQLDTSFAIHDPCPTRGNPEIHSAIRKISEELGLKITEMKPSGAKTLCCGSGGMLGVTNSPLAQGQMEKRAQQAEDRPILTYCQECVESLRAGGGNSLYILDLLFSQGVDFKKDRGTRRVSSLQRWSNRFFIKNKLKKSIREGK